MQQRNRPKYFTWILQSLISKGAWIFLIAACALIFSVQAAMHENTETNNGVLRIHGALSESACRLEMTSSWQDINLGITGTAQLANVGEQGMPVVMHLYLRDCLRAAGLRDGRSGNLLWASYQPVVSVSFTAPADVNNPQLVQVNGSSGLALRLTDELGRDVRLGNRGTPLLLNPRQNTLTYHVIPERTLAPLHVGAYSALVNFRMNYD